MADIFISHSSKDCEVAATIGSRLRRERPSWSLFFDKDNIRAGQRWQERLRVELQSCRMVVVLLSRDWFASPWCFTEVVTATFRGKDVVAIEIEDLTGDDIASAPPILRERQRVRLRDSGDRAFQELLEALDRSGLDPDNWFPMSPGVGPYPGLVAFDEKDAGVFFGRKQDLTEYLGVLDTLRGPDRAQMLVISGASGGGKSSMLRAGLIPRLRRKKGWVVISPFEVAREPVRNLLNRLFETLVGFGIPTSGLDLANPPDDERLLDRTLDEALRRLEKATGAWVLLPIDQAEALLAEGKPAVAAQIPTPSAVREVDQSRLLVDALILLLGRRARCVVVTITIRTEFLPRLEATFSGSEVRLLQAPLRTIGSLAEIIEKPADRYGLELEPGLTERIIEDVQTAGALPLLAYTLKALSDRSGRSRRLTLDEYYALGGVQGAIAVRVALVLSDPVPSAEEFAALRRAFTRHLVRIDENAVEGERRLRRVVGRSMLPGASSRLIDRLVNAGLLVAKGGTIEIAHESVIGDWPHLPIMTWLDQDAADRKLIDQLRLRLGDDTLPDNLLSQAEELVKRDHQLASEEPRIEELVERSRAQRLAREQRRRLVLSIVGFAAFIFAGVASLAWMQWGEAIEQSKIAKIERDRARMQLLAIQARRTTAPDQVDLAAALALESSQIAFSRNHVVLPDAIEVASAALSRIPSDVYAHGSGVVSMAIMPDGRFASVGFDGEIKLWPHAGVGESVVLQHGAPVHSMAVMKDGRLASGGENGEIKLWPHGGVGDPVVFQHGSPVRSLALMKDGRLASGGESGEIKLWPHDGVGKPVTFQHGAEVWSLVVLTDGRLASGGDHGEIKIWSGDGTGEPVLYQQNHLVLSLAVMKDGRLASGGAKGEIILWPTDGVGKPLTLQQSGASVASLVVLPDGRLASGDEAGLIKLWPHDGVSEPLILNHGDWVSTLVALVDGRLASGSYSGEIKLWESVPFILPQNAPVRSMVVLADGRLASSDQARQIKVWPRDGGDEPMISNHPYVVSSLAVLADGRVAGGDEAGRIKLWPRDGAGEPVILKQKYSVWSLVALADGRFASVGFDGEIKLWPHDGVGEPVVLQHGAPVRSLAVMKDGRLASGGENGEIKLWPHRGVGDPMVFQHGSPVRSLAVMKDGRLASGGESGEIRLWPRDGVGKPVTFQHGAGVWSLVVLTDGRIASGGNHEIKVWPGDGAGEPVTLRHGGEVSSLVVLADGRLASGGDDQIKIWLVDEQKVFAALCLRYGRNLRDYEWTRYMGSDTPWQPSCRSLPSNWRTPTP